MSDEKWKKKKLLEQSKLFQSAVIKPLQSETLSRLDKKRKPKKSNFVANRQIFVNPDHSDSGSEHASELDEGSEHAFRATCTSSHKRIPMSSSSSSTTDASSSSTTLSSNDTLDSSIHKFREDFEEFKCKMKIFGESLNLCKCIANDFQGRLSNMEYKLFGLEKRQKTDRKRSNYHQIIQKNKEMETKTKQFVQKLQKCGTEDEMREVAGRICKNYLHGLWKVAQPEELKFRRVTGGLSNFIYSIGLPDNVRPLYERIKRMDEDESREIKSAIEVGDVPKQVLLRIYGQVHGERAMDAIVTESVIFTLLSERRLGPKLYGVFSGGRIEEFIPARPLLIKELREPAISMKIAEKTAAIHSMEIPLSKEPNYIWKTMYKWLKTVKEECFTTGIKGKNNVEITAIKRLKEVNYDHEIEWLKKYLISFESPVVFCHNDLQEGNILYLEEEAHMTGDDFDSNPYLSVDDIQSLPRLDSDEESRLMVPSHPCSTCEESQDTWVHKEDEDENNIHKADSWFDGQRTAALSQPSYIAHNALPEEDTVLSEPSGEPKLYLIDFEYCAYNYRAFDIANHFQEWAYDYTTSYHPFYTERQEDWPTLEQKEIFIREYLKHYNANTSEDKQPVAPDIDQVNKLLAEVDAFALGSHLFWTLWSIVNASKSQIPFGYWEYGLARLDTYQRLKQEVIKKEQYGLPQKRKIEEVDI